MGMKPFEVDFGRNPKSLLDMVSNSHVQIENVSQSKEMLKKTLNDAKFSYKLAKADQSARSNFKYKLHFSKPGDKL